MSPDFDLFENYRKYMLRWPNANFHLVDPRSIWNLWYELQRFTKNSHIRRNPPSSGFIGRNIVQFNEVDIFLMNRNLI